MWIFLLLLPAWTIQDAGQMKLRLQGGDGPCSGRLEVFHEGQWGIVCNHKWQEQNALVVCSSLHCGVPVSTTTTAVFPDSPNKTWMNEVNCNGTEKNLWNCNFNGWGIGNCNPMYHHVNIECSEKIVLSLQHGCAGVVQYKTSNETGNVCESTNWSEKEAGMVCRELGCGEVRRIPGPGIYPATGPMLISALNCTGHEKYLWQCATRFGDGKDCSHPVSVICSNHSNIRLNRNSNLCSGNLEVEVNGNWMPACQTTYKVQSADDLCSRLRCGTSGRLEPASCNGSEPILLTCSDTVEISLLDSKRDKSHCFGAVYVTVNHTQQAVCSKKWNEADGSVVCQELGCGKLVSIPKGKVVQKGWLDEVDCMGSEPSLWYCLARYSKIIECQAANVICEDSVDVRLADHSGRCSGRVEIKYMGTWWRVSPNDWNKPLADAVCKRLHCGESHAFHNVSFSHEQAKVIKLKCPDKFESIAQCIQSPDRTEQKDVKVICKEHRTLYLQGDSPCSGKVGIEAMNKSYWLAGSRETWQEDTAIVVCRQKQCGSVLNFTAIPRGDGELDLWKEEYNCSSNETSLFDCTKHLQNGSDIAVVKCSGSVEVSLEENQCWGKVKVCSNELCGGVCMDDWTTKQSDMLCKNLGCGKSLDLAQIKKNAGVKFSSVYCAIPVQNLSQCNFVPNIDEQFCQAKPAYVLCSGSVKARLVDPKDRCAGNVEVFHSGQWHPVCKKTLQNANIRNVICKEANCVSSDRERDSFYKPTEAIVPQDLTCNTDGTIRECMISSNVRSCVLGGLQCSGSASMLLTEQSACAGRVFVWHMNNSYPVSSEGWGKNEGKVLCKYLRCGDLKDHWGENSSLHTWWNESYSCQGNETNIWACKAKRKMPSKHQQLYISCTDTPTVHLSGWHRCSGQVMITGAATGVCGVHWTEKESEVICQELGCSKSISFQTVKSRRQQSYYVSCKGVESRLWQCGIGQSTCNTGLVSVACADSVEINLTKKCGGEVQIRYMDEKWKPVCPLSSQTSKEAHLICSQLGCGPATDYKEKVASKTINMENSLVCSGEERFIKHCVKKQSCSRQKPAVVYCEKYVKESPRSRVPVIIIVVIVIGILLVIAAALIFWLRTRKARPMNRAMTYSDSGDYEDVIDNENEMSDLMEKSQVPENDLDLEDELGGRSSSVAEYDDVDAEVTDDAQPLESAEGHPRQDQSLGNAVIQERINSQEDYDDVIEVVEPETEMTVVKEPHPPEENGTETGLDTQEDEDYLQPDHQGPKPEE